MGALALTRYADPLPPNAFAQDELDDPAAELGVAGPAVLAHPVIEPPPVEPAPDAEPLARLDGSAAAGGPAGTAAPALVTNPSQSVHFRRCSRRHAGRVPAHPHAQTTPTGPGLEQDRIPDPFGDRGRLVRGFDARDVGEKGQQPLC